MAVRPYKRNGKVVKGEYHIDFYPKGTGKRKMVRFIGSLSEARVYEAEMRRQHCYTPPTDPKVINVLSEYYDWLETYRSAQYLKDMKWAFTNLLPFFGNKNLSMICNALIAEYKKERIKPMKNGKGFSQVNKEVRYLKTFYSWCVKQDYAIDVTFRIDKLPHQKKPPKFFNPADFPKLIDALQVKGKDKHKWTEKKRALVYLMFECGLRWIEASNLMWENIDWSDSIIYLTITKGGRADSCILTESVRNLLEPLKKPEGWVFENPKTGRPLQTIKKTLRTACTNAEIRSITPHMLRRTRANMMLSATGNVYLVKDFLRHSEVSTTQVYLKGSKEGVRQGMRQTAEYFKDNFGNHSKRKTVQDTENKE